MRERKTSKPDAGRAMRQPKQGDGAPIGTSVVGLEKKASLTATDKLQIMSTCLTYSTYESNVYWQRNALYLTINAIIAGFIASTFDNIHSVALVGLAVFGLFFNWHWKHVNEYSKALAEQWRDDARRIARNDPLLTEHWSALLKTSEVERPKGAKPSTIMNRLSASFRFIWALVLVYAIFQLLSGLQIGPFPAQQQQSKEAFSNEHP